MRPVRDAAALGAEIRDLVGRSQRDTVSIMEVCGTHTVSLFRSGARSFLPENLKLLSGPGCPVCVTSQGYLDAACELAARDDVIVATYGDMVRVPGAKGSLEGMRGEGAKVAVVYSARDALKLAQAHPERQVVFLAVGFETTTPATATTVLAAAQQGVDNYSILPAHKLVIPAMDALLAGGEVPVDGFLCPGHVSVVIGADAYAPIAANYGKPCVVAGFELEGMLEAVLRIARQVAADEARVENVYGAAVSAAGNTAAWDLVERVFEPGDTVWRAMGTLPASGLELRPAYRRFDARERFGVAYGPDQHPPGCLCGEVIQGKVSPADCALFGTGCTPLSPIGPCMVSSEGTCAAWYKYRRPAQAAGER
ncbi:MAG: hydrogenase formation protein HypD [Candidatus Krumholzibacteriia bacterium]|nr:hydrogenase formation protein HypD [Candidatus Latescibacterota bacterium]